MEQTEITLKSDRIIIKDIVFMQCKLHLIIWQLKEKKDALDIDWPKYYEKCIEFEFSQTSLKGQGLLLLEQGIACVCSIGEQVL